VVRTSIFSDHCCISCLWRWIRASKTLQYPFTLPHYGFML